MDCSSFVSYYYSCCHKRFYGKKKAPPKSLIDYYSQSLEEKTELKIQVNIQKDISSKGDFVIAHIKNESPLTGAQISTEGVLPDYYKN